MALARAQAENAIGSAHRALWRAAQACEGDRALEGVAQDLFGILDELRRIQESLLKSGPVRSRRQGRLAV